MTTAPPLVHYEAIGQSGRISLDVLNRELGVLLVMRGSWHDAVPQVIVTQIQTALTTRRATILAVDISQCPHLASVALGFLVVAWQTAQAAGAHHAVILATPKISALISILGLNQFFAPVKSSVELESTLVKRY